MEANAAGPTRPESAQSTVPTEHRMMFAHMRVDRQVGKQQRRSLEALYCDISRIVFFVWFACGLRRAAPPDVCAQISRAIP